MLVRFRILLPGRSFCMTSLSLLVPHPNLLVQLTQHNKSSRLSNLILDVSTRITMLRSVLILMALVTFACAFVPQQHRLLTIRAVEGTFSIHREQVNAKIKSAPTTTTGSGAHDVGSTRLHAKKSTPTTTRTNRKSAEPTQQEIDWGKIAGLFLFPGNPYAWFVYFFAFIIIAGTFPGN